MSETDAPSAGDQPAPEDGYAPVTTSGATGRSRRTAGATSKPSTATTAPTPSSGASGSEPTDDESASTSPSSKPSGKPSGGSTRRWRPARNAIEFAGQANQVATMVLNGEIDPDVARIYSGIARTVAQAMSTEVSRARFLNTEPVLSLDVPDDEDDPS